MSYPIIFNLSYSDFIKQVKNIYTCCAFIDGTYKPITEDIRKKIKSGELIISEYHDMPLGEVLYLDAKSNLQ